MKILVAGAAGFSGVHLMQSLFEDGRDGVSYDNSNDGYPVKRKEDRRAILAGGPCLVRWFGEYNGG
jgi:nucleoside-diphosphate-sugar epimerase